MGRKKNIFTTRSVPMKKQVWAHRDRATRMEVKCRELKLGSQNTLDTNVYLKRMLYQFSRLMDSNEPRTYSQTAEELAYLTLKSISDDRHLSSLSVVLSKLL